MEDAEAIRREKRREAAYRNYWRNAERIRERNRVYNYKKKGMEAPPKKTYKLRAPEERTKVVDVVKVVKERMAAPKEPKAPRKKPAAAPAPAPAPEAAVSFTLTSLDFQ